jgi:hypothetical protein
LFYVLLGIAGIVFLWALVELIQSFSASKSLHNGIKRLTEESSVGEAFSGKSTLQKRAAAAVRKAQQPQFAMRFQLDREVGAVTDELAARLSRPRALSGLLIILGLLITLTNLRNAVAEMKSALEPPAQGAADVPGANRAANPSPTPPAVSAEDKVRQGIGGVAAAAGGAFLYSAFAIGGAAFILFLSVLAQRSAASAINAFSTWLLDQNEKVISAQADQPPDTAGKLALAAETLARVAVTFENTNTALADLKLFGEKLENAAQEISKAVANLPTQIDASMTKISGDVAQGIRSGLEHQGEYLKALVAIYSDHALAVKSTIDLIVRVTAANESASASLLRLQNLPEEIRGVATSVSATQAATQELTTTVKSLERRVEALPAEDLSAAANRISDAAVNLSKAESEVAGMASRLGALVQSATADAARRMLETMGQHIEKLGAALQAVKLDLTTDAAERTTALTEDNAKHTAELRSALFDLKSAVGRLGSRGITGTAELERQIERLGEIITRLPSVRLMGLFGGNKARSGRP